MKDKLKLKKIKEIVEDWEDGICVYCNEDFDKCSCHYSLGNAYMEKIQEILK